MSSKFQTLLQQARTPEKSSEPPTEEKISGNTSSRRSKTRRQTTTPHSLTPTATKPIAIADGKPVGIPYSSPAPQSSQGAARATNLSRKPGKRRDPDYVQITAYITKRTHQSTKLELMREGKGRELSTLVEELLADWTQSHS